MMKFSSVLLGAFFALNASASVVAIIDSGVDYKHKDFVNSMWINANEIPDNNRDEDGNGYQDDIYGWNFAKQNNQIIDYKYLGTFSEDPYKYFEVQGRMFWGQTTEEDKKWLASKRGDEKFMKEMGIFGNFVHGTHVAGIAIKDTGSKILGVKLIPTEVGAYVKYYNSVLSKMESKGKKPSSSFKFKMVKALLEKLAVQQMTMMEEIGAYVAGHKSIVANGSFGTGFEQAKSIVEQFYKKGTDEEKSQLAMHFMNALIKAGEEKFVGAAPNTLFVFAAGNEGMDNDQFPTSPANIRADNSITVAATMGRDQLAVFSCYGATKVDVAAPGVTILSSIPGDEYLRVSGTSQAAPYVANVAARVRNTNPKLSPKNAKAIIMGTVDFKDFLKGKVITEGVVNPKRAVRAAELSRDMNVVEAIKQARSEVSDMRAPKINYMVPQWAKGFVFPLPNMFR